MIAAGEVWLVGAGPGDPDLLTRKAEWLIKSADIVFYDALVGRGVLDLAPSEVEQVSVGKRSGRHSKAQDSINDMLLAAASAGLRVVRLKGGDPSVFGRSTEEAEYLRAHGISVRICPGITAASAAVANAGASLSLRGLARRIQFVTAHARADEPLELDWSSLADPQATLAVYMGRSVASEVARKLIAHGLPRETPVLVAVGVSLPSERLLKTRLDLLGLSTASLSDDDPAVLIIGQAVRTNDRVSALDGVTSNGLASAPSVACLWQAG